MLKMISESADDQWERVANMLWDCRRSSFLEVPIPLPTYLYIALAGLAVDTSFAYYVGSTP